MENDRRHNDPIRTVVTNFASDCLITSSRVWREVGDVMSKDVTTISPDATAVSAAQTMSANDVSCIVVMEHGHVVGMVTETDFLTKIASEDRDLNAIRVAQIMTSPVESGASDWSVLEASKWMAASRVKRLPIVDEGRLVGIVTQTDLVRALTSYGLWREVSQIMTSNVATIQSKAQVAEAAEVMGVLNISCILALDGEETVGILTKKDLLKRVVARRRDPRRTAVEEVMSTPVIRIAPHLSVFCASRLMAQKRLRRLVVMEDERLCGIVAQTDVFKAVGRKLEEEERESLALLEKATSSIFNVDSHGMTTYVNPAFLRLFEATDPAQFVGQPFLPARFWLNPEDRARVMEELESCGTGVEELTLLTARGKRIYVTLFSAFTKNAYGEISGSQGVLHDVSERKELVTLRRAEQARKQAEDELRQYALALETSNRALQKSYTAAQSATRAKSQFLANMSHEIRTPMTAILGFAESLIERLDTPEDAEDLDTITRNGQYLLTLIDDILDLSKIEMGKLQTERLPCPAWDIVEEVVSLLSVRAKSKGLSLGARAAGPIPAVISTDPIRLKQILINLVANAIKFTETGSVEIRAEWLHPNGDEPKMRFDVIDTGMGMTEDQIERVFSPFVQGDMSTTRKFGGSGLGLSIAKRMAGLLGGDLTVASAPGKGSTFSVTIATGPLDEAKLVDPSTKDRTAKEPTPPRGCPAPKRKIKLDCRVLLAEDGPDNQRLFTLILKNAGAEVVIAQNGREVLERVLATDPESAAPEKTEPTPFDLILMDMQMPVMDGYEATRRLRDAGYQKPILAFTAYAMKEDRQRCVDAGCDGFVTKPIDRETFLEIVAQHAGR